MTDNLYGALDAANRQQMKLHKQLVKSKQNIHKLENLVDELQMKLAICESLSNPKKYARIPSPPPPPPRPPPKRNQKKNNSKTKIHLKHTNTPKKTTTIKQNKTKFLNEIKGGHYKLKKVDKYKDNENKKGFLNDIKRGHYKLKKVDKTDKSKHTHMSELQKVIQNRKTKQHKLKVDEWKRKNPIKNPIDKTKSASFINKAPRKTFTLYNDMY